MRFSMLFAIVLAWPQEQPARFRSFDIVVDPGAMQLGAYQFELLCDAKIVGIEGGETKSFAEPPFYDAEALSGGRIIIAGFTLDHDTPAGRVRVARVHVMETGATRYTPRLMAAASTGGSRIHATIELGGLR
jgi:hypothetical protein